MKTDSLQAKDYIIRCIKAGITPMLSGSPGIGKSDLIKQIADEYKLELIDIRLSTMDPVDLSGFPTIKDGMASFVPMDIFPLENASIPAGKNGWILFMDELTSAALAVQAAAYRVILDKEIGKHKLHPKVAVIGAGNLSTDDAIVNRMGTAMQSRLIHIELGVTIKEWLVWANQNDIDHRVMAYLNSVPDNLHNFDPRHNDSTFACPQSNIGASYPKDMSKAA